MEISETYSYRHAEAILEKEFPNEREEILYIISSVQWQPKPSPVTRKRDGRIVATLTINQKRTNELFEQEFTAHGWAKHPKIISRSESELVADFKKGPIQVEVQLGNMAR